MPSLVKKIEENHVDGRMLLDDCQGEDLNALVPFPPLRRKLARNIELLRQQAANILPAPANMDEVSGEIQRSLDQLNETLRTLAETVSQESYTASGRLQPLPSDERRRSVAYVEPDKLTAETASIKIQAVARGRQVRTQKLRVEGDDVPEGGTRARDADESNRIEVPVQEELTVRTAENEDDSVDRRATLDRDGAALKIQAVARGQQDRNRVIKMKIADHGAIGEVREEGDVGGDVAKEGPGESGDEGAVIVADVEDSATVLQE